MGCERGRSECPSRAVESKASDSDVYHTKCENSRDSNIKDSRIGLMRVICRCSLRAHSLFQNLTGSCRFFSPTLLRSDIVSRHTQATASSAFTAIVLQRQSCKFYHNAHSNSYWSAYSQNPGIKKQLFAICDNGSHHTHAYLFIRVP